jgi:2-hydroxychromene-2-carboxylate isomerase
MFKNANPMALRYLEADARRAAEMEAAIAANTDKYDSTILENQNSLANSGHWGVPTIVYNGEPFFGQDRVETFLWHVAKKS